MIPPEENRRALKRRLFKDILKERGFTESYNYSFIGEDNLFGFKEKELVELENPMSAFNKYLRPSLIPNLIKNVKENFKNFDRIKFFEIGKVFKEEKGKVKETEMVSGIFSSKKGKDNLFYEIKGSLEGFFDKLGITDIWFDDYKADPEDSSSCLWSLGKSAEIKSNKEEIGFLGQINEEILKDFNIKERVFAFDLNFEKLIELISEENEYSPISFYPSAVRDIAVLVPIETKVVEVLNIINSSGGMLVRDVDLFDIYEGEKLPEGKKNLAFHIVFQAEDRTLSSEEIEKLQEKIIKGLERNPEWEIRK
jgi:phenylalanyl-tRNA synthetase beta chain